jgi:hypothetical protein
MRLRDAEAAVVDVLVEHCGNLDVIAGVRNKLIEDQVIVARLPQAGLLIIDAKSKMIIENLPKTQWTSVVVDLTDIPSPDLLWAASRCPAHAKPVAIAHKAAHPCRCRSAACPALGDAGGDQRERERLGFARLGEANLESWAPSEVAGFMLSSHDKCHARYRKA